MIMTFRWYGEHNDSVKLRYIKQIPGVEGIVWALHDVPAGEIWACDRIESEKRIIEKAGFNIDVVESVNVHESIKTGGADRDLYIKNYIETIYNLGKAGVKVICYNFMPVFDWIRTELFHTLEDGSTALYYDNNTINSITPEKLVELVTKDSRYTVAGWETDRLKELQSSLAAYKGVSESDLFMNLQYFLQAIGPACKDTGIKMALHPDDPPWSVFGLPRIVTSKKNLGIILDLVDEPYNGLTLCTGSLGANPSNDIPDIVKTYIDRIYFTHIRNIRIEDDGNFVEVSHRAQDGSLDIPLIVKAYFDAGYKHYIRPDHGRHIWDEECRPGYGLYDRALGIMYLNGITDCLKRCRSQST